MKQQIEKIQALLLRNQKPAAQHELEVLSQMYDEHLLSIAASDLVKNGNIERLEKELDVLIAERDRLQNNIEGNESHIKDMEKAFEALEKYNGELIAERDYPDFILTPIYAHPLPAQQVPSLSAEQLKQIHRDLDACQKVIWLAGGFDPSYCKEAQESLKLIESVLSAAPKQDQSILNDEEPYSNTRGPNEKM